MLDVWHAIHRKRLSDRHWWPVVARDGQGWPGITSPHQCSPLRHPWLTFGCSCSSGTFGSLVSFVLKINYKTKAEKCDETKREWMNVHWLASVIGVFGVSDWQHWIRLNRWLWLMLCSYSLPYCCGGVHYCWYNRCAPLWTGSCGHRFRKLSFARCSANDRNRNTSSDQRMEWSELSMGWTEYSGLQRGWIRVSHRVGRDGGHWRATDQCIRRLVLPRTGPSRMGEDEDIAVRRARRTSGTA